MIIGYIADPLGLLDDYAIGATVEIDVSEDYDNPVYVAAVVEAVTDRYATARTVADGTLFKLCPVHNEWCRVVYY